MLLIIIAGTSVSSKRHSESLSCYLETQALRVLAVKVEQKTQDGSLLVQLELVKPFLFTWKYYPKKSLL